MSIYKDRSELLDIIASLTGIQSMTIPLNNLCVTNSYFHIYYRKLESNSHEDVTPGLWLQVQHREYTL